MGIENPVHLLFLGLVALLVLGPKRLPDLARAAGKGLREFREVLGGGADGAKPPGIGTLLSTMTEAQPALPAQGDLAAQATTPLEQRDVEPQGQAPGEHR